MANTQTHRSPAMNYERNSSLSHPLLSWRSVIAGLIVSFFSFIVLMALGLALGGVTLEGGIDASTQTAGIIGGVWFLIASLISLALGSFFAARAAKLHTAQVGGAQGILLAALFFGVMFWQMGNIIGFVANTAGSAVSAAASAAQSAANNPALQDNINQAANNLSGAQISEQLQGVKQQVMGNADNARDAAAGTMQAIGWSIFVALILGVGAAYGGGALGAAANVRKPLVVDDMVASRRVTGATV